MTVQAPSEHAWTSAINVSLAHMQSASVAVHVEFLRPSARQLAWCSLSAESWPFIEELSYRTFWGVLGISDSHKGRDGKR